MNKWQDHRWLSLALVLGFWLTTFCAVAADSPLAQAAQNADAQPSEELRAKEGLVINITVKNSVETDTPLQVLCVFDELKQASLAVQATDRRMNGVIQSLRQRGKFAAQPLETLVIAPLPYSMRPRRLLLVGLGKPEALSTALVRSAGQAALREALRLGVREYAQVVEPRDGFEASDFARCLLEGALAAYATEQELQTNGLADAAVMTRITFLTTPELFQATRNGVKQALNQMTR